MAGVYLSCSPYPAPFAIFSLVEHRNQMSLARIENVSKSYNGRTVLDGVDFRVEQGEKIGLIGRNGSGKSTIFRLITGETEAEGGTVDRMRKARIACLAQLPDVADSATVYDVTLSQFRDLVDQEQKLHDLSDRMAGGDESAIEEYGTLEDSFRVAGGYDFRSQIKRVLCGLGFKVEEFDLVFGALSGGQRTRLMLALVLLVDADLLLLDEPENHLDLQAREWLEDFLKDWKKAFVIISHDREMLNAVTTRTVEVERGRLRGFSGNYAAYLKEKVLIRENQAKDYQRQQEFIAREESWINRFRYKNTKARQVQSRIKQLKSMERIEPPESEAASIHFSLGEVVRSGQVVLDARELTMGYGDLVLYQNASLTVERGERVGIIGPNGSGKTTLLRHLAGQLEGGSGHVTLGNKVSIGYYDQHHEDLNEGDDILTAVGRADPKLTQQRLRSFLGRFLFSGDDVFKPIATLSGGERSRVAVAQLVLSGANLLLLDEPTNHLDTASREALEGALRDYPGSIVAVSHDRALIDRLVDKLVIVEDGHAIVHLGNYSHYRWKETPEQLDPKDSTSTDALRIRKKKKTRRAVRRKESEKKDRKRGKRMDSLEEQIHQIEALVGEFEERFAEADPKDHEQLVTLKHEYEGLKRDLGEMYAEWETLSEETTD